MRWSDKAIILKQQPLDDEKILCWILAKEHGLYKGIVSIDKRSKNQVQIGNIVDVNWVGRLPEHLGYFRFELEKSISMVILADRAKVASISSICSLLVDVLPEKTKELRIFLCLEDYLVSLKNQTTWLVNYLKLELIILQELGYGIHLDKCAVTGEKEGLYYLSPKTGMSVTKEAGKAYHDKLFILPKFYIDFYFPTHQELINAFEINKYFLVKNIYSVKHKNIATNRDVFFDIIVNNSCLFSQ